MTGRLHAGAPFWLVRNGMREEGPTAPRRRRYDVVIVGAGVTGALLADRLAGEGLSVLIVDRALPATGSTAASTALLLYELDVELRDLAERIGEDDAVRAYRCSQAAIGELETLAAELGDGCDFARRPSLYLAARRRDAARLEEEAALRARHGIDATFWDRDRLRSTYPFPAHGAIRSETAAVVDPVRLTHAVLTRACDRGAELLTWTNVDGWEATASGVEVYTTRGVLTADRLVVSVGYELPEGLPRDLVRLSNTFAVVTEPVERRDGWPDECLAWETRRPYCYLRATSDGRVMMGGFDTPFRDPAVRDRLLPGRTVSLAKRISRWLPGVEAPVAFTWAGTFAETKDGLPFIGARPDVPNVIYALGYGGNGLTFSAVARGLIADLCLGRENDDARIFRIDR
jgi:glycine/D-amino acid oxidase-like deaminating enzyme